MFSTHSTPIIMAILNYTSDSFYDGGKYNTLDAFVHRAKQCVEEGAAVLDIGAASTRPGAELIDPKEEWKLLKPLLQEVKKSFSDSLISVDTYNSYTAEKCIEYGANIINDISGGTFDTKMLDVISKSNVYYVLMHTSDIPKRMQQNTDYINVVQDIKNFFRKQITVLENKGFEKVIIDPGFGFGKTIEQNYELLNRLDEFKELQKPIMAGISRKNMIYKKLNTTPDNYQTLIGTVILNTIAVEKGAKILRVHDVRESQTLKKMLYYNKK